MSGLTVWIIIAGLTFVTVATRSLFLVLGDQFELPAALQRGLRYAPVCALMALIAPELVLVDGTFVLTFANPKLLAGVAAAVTVIAARSMVLAMAVGMAVLTAARFWLA